jgi:hypothetical protein
MPRSWCLRSLVRGVLDKRVVSALMGP